MADAIAEPQSSSYTGLTDAEARERLRQYGPNVLPSGHRLTLFSIVLGTLKEPMLILLLSTGLVYLLVGDLREAIAILASIFMVIGISTTQKHRTERTLEALRDLTSPRALVMRSEETRRIPAREVVPGDIVILNEGDRVPADGQVLESALLALDESLLTGESVPVDKQPAIAAASAKAGGSAMVYSATLVVRGHGIIVVSATGAESEIGKIGTQLGQVRPQATKLERETAKLVRAFGILGLLVCGFVAGMYGLLRGDWAKGVISALALAISLVPEEFPLVLAIFMAIGAWRISQKKVLTPAIPCHRNAGGSHRYLRGQDRHADGKPDGGARSLCQCQPSGKRSCKQSRSAASCRSRLRSEHGRSRGQGCDRGPAGTYTSRPPYSRIPAVLRLHAGRESL